jgi:hypothetical protein
MFVEVPWRREEQDRAISNVRRSAKNTQQCWLSNVLAGRRATAKDIIVIASTRRNVDANHNNKT